MSHHSPTALNDDRLDYRPEISDLLRRMDEARSELQEQRDLVSVTLWGSTYLLVALLSSSLRSFLLLEQRYKALVEIQADRNPSVFASEAEIEAAVPH